MPVTLREKLDSRKWNTGGNASVEMVYVLTGISEDLTAKTLIESSTPETYNGLVRQSISLEEVSKRRRIAAWSLIRSGWTPPAATAGGWPPSATASSRPWR